MTTNLARIFDTVRYYWEQYAGVLGFWMGASLFVLPISYLLKISIISALILQIWMLAIACAWLLIWICSCILPFSYAREITENLDNKVLTKIIYLVGLTCFGLGNTWAVWSSVDILVSIFSFSLFLDLLTI